MKNYLFRILGICFVCLFFACSQDVTEAVCYENMGVNDYSLSTRSFSSEEDVIAVEIQTRLDSIGAKYGEEIVLVSGTDISKIDESFFEFVEKSLSLQGQDTEIVRLVSINADSDSLIDDSSINKIGVRAISPTETGFYTWESEELFEYDLCFKFKWTVGPTVKTSVSGSIVYDTNKYSLSSFTYSTPSGSYNNISCYYTAIIKEKKGLGNLVRTYSGVL